MEVKNVDLFFSENPNPMYIYDPSDLTIKEVNQATVELYGYSKEEMRSLRISDLRPRSEVPKLKKHLSSASNKVFENAGIWRHQKKNGDLLYVHILTNPVSYGEEEYKLVIAQNVTSQLDFQQKYQMLFENSLDGVMLTNPNGDILKVNQAACKMLGMSEQEIIREGREGLVAKDDKLERALEKRSETGQFSGELTFIHRTGRRFPVELTTSVFTNSAGEQRTSLIFRDISERKKTEKALRNQRDFTEVVLNSLPGIFFLLNEKGEVIRWNDHSTDVFGLTSQEIEGRPAVDFVHEEDKQRILNEIAKVFEEGHSTVELKLNTADNSTAFYRFVANKFQQDDRTYIIGSGVDVTKQKELEHILSSLLQEEQTQRKEAESDRDKLKKMFEKAPSPKCVLEGPEFRYVIANESYRKVIGKDDIIGKKLTDVLPEIESQGIVDILKRVYLSGKPYMGKEKPVKIPKGESEAKEDYIFNLLFAPLFDENGEVYGIFVEALDVSDQLNYQHQLEESLKEKETLLAEIHHRVKNNLAIVSSMMELQALDSDDATLQETLRTGQQRIQTIAIIHELLYESESLSYVNLGKNIKQLIDSLQNMYGDAKEISIEVQSEQIALNINQAIPCALMINEVVTNAFKHAFKEREEGTITVKLQEDEGLVQVDIADDGAGLPEGVDLDRSKTLGMTLINSLVQQLEGDLEISSDEGTRFLFEFEKSDVTGIGSSFL